MDEENEENWLHQKALDLLTALKNGKPLESYDAEDVLDMCEILIDRDALSDADYLADFGITKGSQVSEFYRLKALIASLTDAIDRALECIDISIDYDSTNAHSWLLKAGILDLQDQPLAALDCLDHAETLGIDRDEILLQKAKYYLHADNEILCQLTLETLLSKKLEYEDSFLEVYLLIQNMEAFHFGTQLLENYTNLDPFAALAWHFLGDCHDACGNSDEAIESYDLSIALEGQYESSYISKGMIYMNQQNFWEALRTFKVMVERCGESATALFLIGECYRKNGQHTLARKYFTRCLKQDQSYALAWSSTARSYMDTSDYDQALGYMKKALKLSPDDTFIRFDYASLLVELNMFDEAKTLLTEGLKIDTDFPPFHTLYADVCFSTGNKQQAVDYLKRLDLKLIDDAVYHYKMAAYLYATGDVQGCMEAAQRGLELNYDFHSVIFESFPPTEDYPPLLSLIDLYDLDPEE